MPSVSFGHWKTSSLNELDEIERAHQTVGGISRGRRYATLQLNYAYAMLLSSQFQRYCRDLHSEAINHLLSVVRPGSVRPVLREEFTLNRKLDKGNPNPGNIGADFGRLGMTFWQDVQRHSSRNASRR